MMIAELVMTSIFLLVFGLLLTLAALRLRSRQNVVFHLALYLGLGFFSYLSQLLIQLNIAVLPGAAYALFATISQLAMIMTYGALTLSFLMRGRKVLLGYWGITLFILILWSLLNLNFLANPIGETASAANIGRLLAALAWTISLLTSFVALGREFRKQHSAKYRNRLGYWLVATTLMGAAGLIRFISPTIFFWAGLPLIIVASILVTYVVLSYHTKDLNLLIGQALYYLGMTGSIAIILYLSLAATIIVSRSSANPISIFLWSVIVAVLLAVITPLIQKLLNRPLTRIIFGKTYRDEKQIIRRYSQSFGGALDMNRLSDTVIRLMVETLDIKHGLILIVQRSETDKLSFEPFSYVGISDPVTGFFTVDSPFIDYFRKGNNLLYQYDIEVLPDFATMDENEKSWLNMLEIELFVPIMRQRELVGLLAIGSPSRSTTFSETDTELMVALADHAALVMDSARLFERLRTTNQTIGSLSEELAGLDQNKADFLSIASHELRTPLTHVQGYAQILADFSDEEFQDPNQVRSVVEGIVSGSQRLRSVVDLMFDVSEANVGEMSLFLGPVNLKHTITEATDPYLSVLDERRLAFDVQGFDEAPIVEADGARLEQAFGNLISNAIKYTPDGGLVKITGQSIVIDEIGSAFEVIVADTGIGIDPEYHEQVFEKFFRVDDTDHHSTSNTKFKGAGPGLGLTLVKGIAKAHGGRVWVESLGCDEVNCPGSEFRFVIPLHPIIAVGEDAQKQSQIETVHWRSKDLKVENK